MKQVLSQHIREQNEGSSRKKAGFFSSLFFALAMSCSIVDNRPYGCFGGYYGIVSWNTAYKPVKRIDFIHDSSIRDLIGEMAEEYANSYHNTPKEWLNIPYWYFYGSELYPSPEIEEEEQEPVFYWYPDNVGLKEEEIILDKFAPLKVA